jgi:hyaluronoglucosaminidase
LWVVRDSTERSRYLDLDTSRVPVALDRVRILYRWFGTYPEIRSRPDKASPVVLHGGIPQRIVEDDSLWTLHVQTIRRYLDHPHATVRIDSTWSGYAIIDFEAWSPLWERTPRPYREASIAYERERSRPDLSEAVLEQRARVRYERAARTYLTRTLMVADSLRPRAKWGYYGFPHPGRVRNVEERRSLRASNDALRWLYEAAEVIYPSIYLIDRSTSASLPSDGEASWRANCYYMRETLSEAFRIARGRPVVPLTSYEYHVANPVYRQRLITEPDVALSFSYPFAFPIDALVVWGLDDLSPPLRHLLYDNVAPVMYYVEAMRGRTSLDERWFTPTPCMPDREPAHYERWHPP